MTAKRKPKTLHFSASPLPTNEHGATPWEVQMFADGEWVRKVAKFMRGEEAEAYAAWRNGEVKS